jgi:hypothetical protein
VIYSLGFYNHAGIWTEIALSPSEYLKFSSFYRRLADAGYGFPVDDLRLAEALHVFLISQLAPAEYLVMVPHMGWHDQKYLLPGKTRSRHHLTFLYRPTKHSLPYEKRGSTQAWKSLTTLAKNSPGMVFAVGLAFAAPLLELIGRSTVGVYCASWSVQERAALAMAAASVFGLPSEFPSSLATVADAAIGHNGALMVCQDPFDDHPADHPSTAKQFEDFVARISADTGSFRIEREGAKDYRTRIDWTLAFIVTGPPRLIGRGSRSRGGRRSVIELPLNFDTELGIYASLPDGYRNASDVSRDIIRLARENHGVGIQFVKEIEKDLDAIATNSENNMSDFIEKMVKTYHARSDQIQLLSTIYAGLCLAADLKILPWSTTEMKTALARCYDQMRHATPDPAALVEEGVAIVIERLSRGNVLQVERYSHQAQWTEEELMSADGIRRHEPPPARIFVLPTTYYSWFANSMQAKIVLGWLSDHKYLIVDSSRQIMTNQASLPGLPNRRRFLTFKADFWDKFYKE